VFGSHPVWPSAGAAGSTANASAAARKTVRVLFLPPGIVEIHLAWIFLKERPQELSLVRVNPQENCVKR
jgi:hypothetical protein